MSGIKLSKRLCAVAALVPSSGGLADVGTDHGYIPVRLAQNGFSGEIFATDINAGPLERAKQTAAEHGLDGRIRFHLCDGLGAVDGDLVATVIIAGMGGETIAHILENAPWTRRKLLILQPMSKSERLREWLLANAYRVLSESLVEDGALYELLTATGGADLPYEDGEALTGRFSLVCGNELFPARLSGLITKTERAIAGLEGASAALSEKTGSYKKTLAGLLSLQSRL